MPSVPPSPPKAKRRWGQFGLRSLFVFMTLAAICVGLFAARMNRAERQAAAVSRLRGLAGGTIGYSVSGQTTSIVGKSNPIVIPDGTSSTINFVDVSHSRLPFFLPWLERHLGVDFFRDVVEVGSWNYIGNDDELAELKSFPRLRRVDFIGAPNVTDEGLVHLAELHHLEYVRLGGSRITDDGVARLTQALPNCQVER